MEKGILLISWRVFGCFWSFLCQHTLFWSLQVAYFTPYNPPTTHIFPWILAASCSLPYPLQQLLLGLHLLHTISCRKSTFWVAFFKPFSSCLLRKSNIPLPVATAPVLHHSFGQSFPHILAPYHATCSTASRLSPPQ